MRTELSTARWPLFVNFLGSLFFICLYLWMILTGFDVLLIVKILAGGLILVFAYTGLCAFRQLLSKESALIIDDKGITIPFFGFDTAHVAWAEIESVGTSQLVLSKFVAIKLRDEKAFIAQVPLRSKIYAYIHQRYYGSKIVLSEDSIDVDGRGGIAGLRELIEGMAYGKKLESLA